MNCPVYSDFPARSLNRVLLLQGPVGPFFARLQGYLEAAGVACWRVCFNAGDRHFAARRGRIDFSGSLGQWRDWLRACLEDGGFDAVVGFGCFRPQHVVARRLAEEAGLAFLSLEEGYLRSGFHYRRVWWQQRLLAPRRAIAAAWICSAVRRRARTA